VSDVRSIRLYCVRNPLGEVVARFDTFEEAMAEADRAARRAKLPGLPGVCWEVVREPGRWWRWSRVLHRASPAPPGRGGGGGEPGGVREPRRPRPGSSSGAIALDLPD
jgi:hypothetical protein